MAPTSIAAFDHMREKLVRIASAVREKTSTSQAMTLDQMADAIASISGGGQTPQERACYCSWQVGGAYAAFVLFEKLDGSASVSVEGSNIMMRKDGDLISCVCYGDATSNLTITANENVEVTVYATVRGAGDSKELVKTKYQLAEGESQSLSNLGNLFPYYIIAEGA